MYLTIKQQVKQLSKEDIEILKYLCYISKNITNEAIYNVRQHYFNTGKYLSYYDNCKLIKSSENYKILNANMGQQLLRNVDSMFMSYFKLLKLKLKGAYKQEVKLPYYLDKDSPYILLIATIKSCINNGMFYLPYSRKMKNVYKPIKFKIPSILKNKKVKEIQIIPKFNAAAFDVHYIYEIEENQNILDKNKALGIDFGINNLMTCVTNEGKSFIIDGKKLKSINQFYNKWSSKFYSINSKQNINFITKQLYSLSKKRTNRCNDYIHKTINYILNYCLKHRIGNLVIGFNKDFQRNSNLGKKNNQTFVNIPYSYILKNLKIKCKLNGINFIEQEESYTSKASFWDKDEIPIFDENNNKKYKFSGKRIKRGLYRTSTGYEFNADCNGALNILRKSNVVSLEALYSRGKLDTPLRIRID